ncbi:Spc98 family-domain-containing protein [Geopyxis carbonaria]|nr:Spc98 family-domain-containing protein [Geopyxis carbonaria]
MDERIDTALTELVEHFFPFGDDEDPEQDAIIDDALERAHTIIETHPPQSELVVNTNHVGDQIKARLLKDHPTPEQALRFSALFNRLQSQPVLNRKWAILKLMDTLAGSGGAVEPEPPVQPDGMDVEEAGEEVFRKAFSYQGLHRLPGRDAVQTEGPENVEDPRDTGLGLRTKAEILAEHGLPMEPSEQQLLSALPFTLLGVSSTALPVVQQSRTSDTAAVSKYALQIPPTLPLPLVSLLHSLAEPALLYKTLDEFVRNSPDGEAGGGLVGQSLRSAIGIELRGYVNLIGGLESEIRRAVAATEAGQKVAGVTLKRCVVWTREAVMGLRLMSLIVDKTQGQRGGQLVSTIHSFASSHGDPFVHAFAERLLIHITRPFYDMLRHWIYEGELTDPYNEFFVSDHPSEEVAKGGASSVWQDKYKFAQEQVPTIITESFANRVFLIGKSLNFIRHGCSDSDWVEGYSKTTSKELRYGDTAKLEMNIDEAYNTTMARLIDLMNTKFKLFDHLVALKKFLLLGQGDFIALLMESLAANLDRPANTLYRHNLTAQLEHAIRGSNAQFDDAEVLRRLDARMLELSHGEVGWDVFTLEYKIDAPVDVVVTPHGSKQYLKVFNFLWRIKRVEYALGSCWRRFMTGARGVLRAVDDLVGNDWKLTRCVIAEMVHFVNQLQYYILFEVIESSWDQLQAAITKPGVTLDDLIDAHAKYLQHITRKGLLGSHVARTGRKRAADDAADETFLSQLHEILKTMLLYRETVDGLYGHSVAEFTRRQERGARVEARTAHGDWGVRETVRPPPCCLPHAPLPPLPHITLPY